MPVTGIAAGGSVSGLCVNATVVFLCMPPTRQLKLSVTRVAAVVPGGNVEYAPAEFLKNGCNAVHLATGLVVGYPPCPHIQQFKEFIEKHYGLPVVVGTHPIPLKYLEAHNKLSFWEQAAMQELAGHLMTEGRDIMESYN